MFVEKLSKKEIYDMAFKILIEKAHKNPEISYTGHNVTNVTRLKDVLFFEIFYYENDEQDTLKCLQVKATDSGVYLDKEYCPIVTKYLVSLIATKISNKSFAI